ncbi:MAG: hypothetical protein HDS68_06855 [Bacteroidales bacterium]|nr:hypothetical protein [Bacteroidales bacterium]
MNHICRRLSALAATVVLSVTVADAQQWRNVGSVEFTDGWLSPYFLGGNSAVINVEAQLSEDGTLVRLLEPYSSDSFGEIAGYDTTSWGAGRYIIFDISDKNWVTLHSECEAVCLPAGVFGDSELPLWVNTRGLYMNAIGYDRDAVTAAGMNATYSDGKIMIPQCMVSFGAEPDAFTQSFGDLPVSSVVDLTSVGLTAIECPGHDEADAPVRYFTIDGSPVQDIRNPGIYLQCRGSLVYKTVVR